jgi:drug/metabolite transporter (DMT)-like permease
VTVRRLRVPGVILAGATALVSGISVFVNSYGVRAGATPAVYTTAKNLVAVAVLSLLAMVGWGVRRRGSSSVAANFVAAAPEARSVPATRRWVEWLGLAYVGAIGGGLAFVLFFDGLAVSEPGPAAFWRDTLVLWVAVLAILFLRERLRWWNVAAIALLFGGEIMSSAVALDSWRPTTAKSTCSLSSVLWAFEVVIARRLC